MVERREVLTMLMVISVMMLAGAPSFGQEGRSPAPELRGQGWVNTLRAPEQLRLTALQGQVVVLLFFVANDTNSAIALDQGRQLWAAYQDRGLEVLGVHSPPEGWNPRIPPDSLAAITAMLDPRADSVTHQVRLELQRRLAVVQDFVTRRRVPFPILADHDRALWDRYRNQAYPTFQVIDPDGILRGTFIGTQAYQALSQQVDTLLSAHARAQAEQARRATSRRCCNEGVTPLHSDAPSSRVGKTRGDHDPTRPSVQLLQRSTR